MKQIDGTEEKEKDNEEDGEGQNKVFAQQRGPKKNEKKPECVKHLEQVEEDHDFAGR